MNGLSLTKLSKNHCTRCGPEEASQTEYHKEVPEIKLRYLEFLVEVEREEGNVVHF